MAIGPTRINVKMFGATGDGTTDDSNAVLKAIEFINQTTTTTFSISWGGDGNEVTQYILYFPAGKYLITKSIALMSPYTRKDDPLMGLVIEGDGRFMTSIRFNPSTSGQYLMSNNNSFLHMTFRDLSFVASTTNASWMRSFSNGFGQNYSFERVAWGGTWSYGLVLEGNNTNSEMSWHHCNFNGNYTAWLYVPQSVGMVGDQFVNYNFYTCNFEVSQGSFLDMAYGGSIGIWGGSFMMVSATSLSQMIRLRNQSHNGGACRFIMAGTRVELATDDAMLIECDWGFGAVTFINVDTSTQQFQDPPLNNVNAKFNFGNDSGPAVSWINCTLQGKHEYTYGQNHFTRSSRIVYDNCEFWHYSSPEDAITFTNTSGIFFGGAPIAQVRNSRGIPGDGQANYVWDTTLNWNANVHGVATQRVIKLSAPWNSGLPNKNWPLTAVLPLNAIVTQIRIFLPAGSESPAAGWSYTIKNSEGSPVTLATATPTGDDAANGIDFTSADLFYICSTDQRRTLVLQASAAIDGVDPGGYCMIFFVA